MTTIGKILVFVNLAFSLVVCALIIMVYIARTNWHDAYTKQKALYDVAAARAKAADEELKAVYDETRDQLAKADAAIKKAEKELEERRAELKAAQENLKNMAANKAKADATVAKLQAEVQKRAEEVKKMEEFLKVTNDRNTELVKEMNRLRELKTASDIENKTLRFQNQNLIDKLAEREKELVRMRATGGAVTSSRTVEFNPPPQDVEGVVKNTDSSGLVTISIGSDSGVLKGHTLEVFRLDPVPSRSMYLGTIRILETRPHEAVGQPVSRPRAPIQVGDRVASRITSGG
jgi:sugar-specific transcriptional regulator TrmB